MSDAYREHLGIRAFYPCHDDDVRAAGDGQMTALQSRLGEMLHLRQRMNEQITSRWRSHGHIEQFARELKPICLRPLQVSELLEHDHHAVDSLRDLPNVRANSETAYGSAWPARNSSASRPFSSAGA